MRPGVAFLVAAALAAPGRSMQSQAGASLAGIVWNVAHASPVVGASVRIEQLGREVRTDTTGRFLLGALAPGRYRIEIRRMGYPAVDTTLTVSGETVAIIRVNTSAQPLERVDVNAPVMASDRMAGFETRRMQGHGRFLTRDDLEKAGDRQLTEVILRLGGSLRILRNQSEAWLATTLQQAQGALKAGCALPGGKGAIAAESLECGRLRGCLVQIFVDGVRVFGQGPDKNQTPPNLDEFLVRNLESVEFYSSPSRTPPEFQTNTAQCGTLVIWTRT